jgi:hypothetical protein
VRSRGRKDFDVGRFEFSAALLTLCLIGCALLLPGCAAKAGAPRIAAEFQGVWVTADPRYTNWWEIHADRVLNYGVTSDGARCGAHFARILSSDQIESSYGVIDKVRLRIVDKNLKFEGSKVLASYHRAGMNEICRRSDGSYFKDAPFVPSR